MEFSIAGAVVCAALIILMRLLHASLVVALLASFAFGSTALVSLTAIGGSSPLIFAFFLIAFVASFAVRRHALRDLGAVMAQNPAAWLILFLTIYVVIGAIFLPRLFAGQTSVFVPSRIDSRVAEMPLGPVSGNITQTFYFVLSALSFFAFSILLSDRRKLDVIRQGMLAWTTCHVAMGFIDLAGKMAGAGDVLLPIRSATYSLLTSVVESGFWRITGGYSEASAFGAVTLSLLAFWLAYWRHTNDRIALGLSAALAVLLILSTSSTAYVGAALISIPLFLSISKTAMRGRLSRQDLLLLLFGVFTLIAGIAVYLYEERFFDPIWQLLNTMVLNKASSASAQERAYWNMQSLKSFYDTNGLGVGMGSSRASSWIVAVVSQLGVIGSVMLAILVSQILRRPTLVSVSAEDRQRHAIAYSVRSCAIAGLVTSSISSGDADPGLRFFMALAVLHSLRPQASFHRLRMNEQNTPSLCSAS